MVMYILPQLKKKKLFGPNINCAETEKPWILQRGRRCFSPLPGHSSWNEVEGSVVGAGGSRSPDPELENSSVWAEVPASTVS